MDKFTVKFEHIATTIPEEVEITPKEFELLTTKPVNDRNTSLAWTSMWLRNTPLNSNTGRFADQDIEEWFNQYFFEGVFKNGQLRSH
jgi:hypothetical protein